MLIRKHFIRTISWILKGLLIGGIIYYVNSLSVFAGDFSETLEKSITLYEKGDFNVAVRELKNVVRELELISGDKGRTEDLYIANLYLGLSYLGNSQDGLARESFRRAIVVAPDKTLDPELFPPKVISLYQDIISQNLSNLSVQSNIPGAEVFIEDVKKGVDEDLAP